MNDDIKSAARVLDMLELFSTRCDGLSLTEVARGLNLPKSSALGLLRTLSRRGYLVRDDEDLYRLNDIVRRDGFARHGRLLRVSPPVMRELADAVGETVILGMTGDRGVVRLIAKEAANRDIRFDIDLPRQVPAYCTAIGRMLLSAKDDGGVRAALSRMTLNQHTDRTVTDIDRLVALVADARAHGVAIVEDEFALGGTGIACLIPLAPDHTHAALNIGCVSARFPAVREKLVGALTEAAARIGAAIGPDRAP
jgi:DNA-binding IclR family transcriptional regulator